MRFLPSSLVRFKIILSSYWVMTQHERRGTSGGAWWWFLQYPTILPEKLYFVLCRMTAGTLKNHLVYGWIEVRTRLGNHQYKKTELHYYNVDVPQVILTVKLSFFSPHTLYNACFSRDSMRVKLQCLFISLYPWRICLFCHLLSVCVSRCDVCQS